MAELDSYVTGVGEHPTAPDTSIYAYMDENPVYSQTDGGRKWWYGIADYIANDMQVPALNIHYKDWSALRGRYQQWKQQKENEYNALVKTWQTAQASPLNYSELLKAAGYNRNFLQGAAGATPTFSDDYHYSPQGPKGPDPFSDSASMLNDSVQGLVNAGLVYLEAKDKEASANLKNAQAHQITSLLPYKKIGPYVAGAKWYEQRHNDTHSPAGFGFSIDGDVIGYQPYDQASLFDNIMRLEMDSKDLKNQFNALSVEKQRYVNDQIMPIEVRLKALEEAVLQGKLTGVKLENELQELDNHLKSKYGEKNAEQEYILNWWEEGRKTVGTVADIVLGAKRLPTPPPTRYVDTTTGEILK